MIIDVLLPLSLLFIMFTLGLGLTTEDFIVIFKQPKAFKLGILNQMVVLPLISFLIIFLVKLENEMAVGIMILSCCPGGVTSNMITKLIKGDVALSISLTAIVSIISVITLPFIVGFSMEYFMGSNTPSIDIINLGFTMFLITSLPVSIGIFVNSKYKKIAKALIKIANRISTTLFVIIVIGALVSEWKTFINNINTLGSAIFLLAITMLLIGYYTAKFFNLEKRKCFTIAIESSIQNATVGITIGNLILIQSSGLSPLSLPSGVYGIFMYVVCLPAIFLLKKLNN